MVDRSEQRILEEVRAFVDTIEVPTPACWTGPHRGGATRRGGAGVAGAEGGPESTVPPPGTPPFMHPVDGDTEQEPRRISRRAVLTGAAAAASLVGIVSYAGTLGYHPPQPAVDGDARALPTRLPGYWPLRPTLEMLPTGRVGMVYMQVEAQHLPDEPSRMVTLDDRFGGMRSLATANDRENYTTPAPTIVSDDGRWLAVGSISWQGEVVLVDAESGRTRTVRVTDAPRRDVQPLAFSPDGAAVFVRDQSAAFTPNANEAPYGRVMRVGVTDGTVRDLGLGGDIVDCFPSPDGRRLLVARRRGHIEIVAAPDATSGDPRVDPSIAVRLDTAQLVPHAWSPDGRRMLALDAAREALHVLDPEGGHHSWPLSERVWNGVAWSGPDTYLVVLDLDDDPAPGRLGEIDVRTGDISQVAEWETWPVTSHIREISMAANLAWGLRVTRTPLAAVRRQSTS